MSWKVLPLALAAILNIAAPEKEAFTLEQVLSAPFPVDLTAARRAERFSYEDAETSKNVATIVIDAQTGKVTLADLK